MARPKEPAKRVELALRAIEILEREGVEISTERLAGKIGIKRPTLLYHFPSYASIGEEAVKHYAASAQAFVAARLEPYSHPVDRVFQHAVAVADYQRGKEARFLFLTHLIASTSGQRLSQVAQATALYFEAHRAHLVKQLREGIDAGLVAPCDPKAIVMMIRGLADGLMIQRVATKDDTGCVYELLWNAVLAPLKRQPQQVRGEASAAPHPTKTKTKGAAKTAKTPRRQ